MYLRLIDLPKELLKTYLPSRGVRFNSATLPAIFSWGNPWGESSLDDIRELHDEIERGAVTVEVAALPHYDGRPLHRFSGRGDEHRELCARAAAWLEAQGLGPADVDEPRYPFGFNVRADVGSKGGKMLIEAGYTYSAKVLQALPEGLTIGVAPYAEHVGERDEVLFVFTRAKPLKRETRDMFAVDPLAGVL